MKSKNPIDESIKLQLEAKALGLDWIELNKIISKIREVTDELEEAITIAERVPQKVPAYSLVEQQIQEWQKTWNQARKTW